MSKQTEKSLFIDSSATRLYQQLFIGAVSYETLGNHIIKQIKAAHAFRRIEQVRELAGLLLNIPVKEYQLIAQYYQAWCDCREKRWDTKVLERVAEQSRTYQRRALMSLAAVEGYKRDCTTELFYFNEALKTSPDVSDFIEISKAVAVIKAKEGFHKQALSDIESVLPILKHANPFAYYDFLNSYAVELGETGRKQEARNISRVVLASPFIHAYPEWQETARELKEANRSFVAFEPTANGPRNVVHMPVAEHGKSEQLIYNQPARVVNLQRWKTKMGKDKKPLKELNTREIINRIIVFYTNKKTTNAQRYKIWEAAQKVMFESYPPDSEPDDSGGA